MNLKRRCKDRGPSPETCKVTLRRFLSRKRELPLQANWQSEAKSIVTDSPLREKNGFQLLYRAGALQKRESKACGDDEQWEPLKWKHPSELLLEF